MQYQSLWSRAWGFSDALTGVSGCIGTGMGQSSLLEQLMKRLRDTGIRLL